MYSRHNLKAESWYDFVDSADLRPSWLRVGQGYREHVNGDLKRRKRREKIYVAFCCRCLSHLPSSSLPSLSSSRRCPPLSSSWRPPPLSSNLLVTLSSPDLSLLALSTPSHLIFLNLSLLPIFLFYAFCAPSRRPLSPFVVACHCPPPEKERFVSPSLCVFVWERMRQR